MIYNFKGKVILVLAGSKGIGLEIANQFFRYNGNVIIVSRNSKNLLIAKNKILKNKKSIGDIATYKFDISNTSLINSFCKKIEKKYITGIDILINNSGGPAPKSVVNITKKEWKNAFDTNFNSAVSFSTYFVKKMIKKKYGRIINLTSSTAKEPGMNFALSNVPRAALSSFSKTLSLEVAKHGITVNNILTGGVLTERLEGLVKKNMNSSANLKKEIKKLSDLVPVGHLASAHEFVQIILFLASPESSYVNGTSISVDGGTSKSIF